MMIAAGGEALKIHMHSDLFPMEQSLLSYVCAESSILGTEEVGRKKKLRKLMGLYGHVVDLNGHVDPSN